MRVFVSVCGWLVAPWLMVLLWFIGGPELRKNVGDGFLVIVKIVAVVVAAIILLGILGSFLEVFLSA